MRHIIPGRPNAYTGGSLNRAAHHRDNPDWLAEALAHEATRFVVFRQGRPLMLGMAERDIRAALTRRPDAAAPYVFLGLQDNVPMFAADITEHDAGPLDGEFVDMRAITGVLPQDDATILATARAMLHWRAQTKFCSVCGGPNEPIRGGYVLLCSQCNTEHFPRSDPAVIMLVALEDRLLLGQSHKFPVNSNFYSTLAGFVEPGENLEDAVRREVFEEVGVTVGDVYYHSSQPWPFPASLMLGFYGQALTEEITLDETEMRDARWFTRADIANRKALGFSLPPVDSIARSLIDDWLRVQDEK